MALEIRSSHSSYCELASHPVRFASCVRIRGTTLRTFEPGRGSLGSGDLNSALRELDSEKNLTPAMSNSAGSTRT